MERERLTQNTLLHDRYLILEQLEHDGTRAATYLAEDKTVGSSVIIEEIRSADGLSDAIEREARLMSGLRHSALQPVTDYFNEGDNHYIVTSQVAGESPAKLIEEIGAPFSLPDVARFGNSLLGALDYLHTQEPVIVHGNVRPENLKITDDGQAVLLHPPQMALTSDSQGEANAYNSPEQVAGTDMDDRSDLYSAGATLYYLLTGVTPIDAQSRLDAVAKGEDDPLARADQAREGASSDVAAVLNQAMSLDRNDRYDSASEMRDALSDATDSPDDSDEAPAVAATQVMPQAATPAKRKANAAPWIIGALAVLAVVATTIFFLVVKGRPGDDAKTRLSAREMEIIFQEFVPRQAQELIAQSPAQKKMLVKDIKERMAVAQQAEAEGYADKDKVKSELALASDRVLYSTYKQKNPTVQVSDEDINAYYQAHPTAFDDFINSNPELKEQVEQQKQMLGPQAEVMMQQFKKQLGEVKVLVERAHNEKMDQDDVVKTKILFGRTITLHTAYMEDLQKNIGEQVKPEDVEPYYQQHQGELDEVKVRHILFALKPGTGTADEKHKKAQEALARARNGEDFAHIATEMSEEPIAKMNGGDMGFVWKGTGLPDEFESAMLALQPGQISDIVETSYGFHIIKVEERRPKPSPAGDEKARQEILDFMKQERVEKRVDEIVASNRVEIAEDFKTTPKPVEQQPAGLPPGPGGQP